jgi:surface protein
MSWFLLSTDNNWKGIVSSGDGTKLVAISMTGSNQNGGIYVYAPNNPGSDQFGWFRTSAPQQLRWYSLASDLGGVNLVAVALNDGIYTSANSGTTWTQSNAPSKLWYGVTCSESGQNMVAVAFGGGIWQSINYGANWSEILANSIGWYGVASSGDGTKLVAVSLNNGIWTSSNTGVSWTQTSAPLTVQWSSVASSQSGQRLIAGANVGIWISNDAGLTWTKNISLPYVSFFSVASSQDGQRLIADAGGLYGVYISTDYGMTWLQTTGNFGGIGGVASSADGKKLFVAAYSIGIYAWTGEFNDPMILILTGFPAGNRVDLPLLNSTGTFLQVDWGDGTIDTNKNHIYLNNGNYTVKISVTANYSSIVQFGDLNWSGSQFLTSITQWGDFNGLAALNYIGGPALTVLPPTVPSTVTDMSFMFYGATAFNGNLSGWDVSNVTTMADMFFGATSFNGSLYGWTLTNITTMSNMFDGARALNQDLNSWTIGTAGPIDMSYMFSGATKFNGSLSGWNVTQVTDMSLMFSGATAFNGTMDGWTLSNITTMSGMFNGATSFNEDLTSWTIGTAGPISMREMFSGATAFNGSLSGWNVTQVTDMSLMFYGATSFNGTMDGWTLTNITTMSNMFDGATSFNQDLNSWIIGIDISGLPISMREMFSGATAFNRSLDKWNVREVTDMGFMFQNATSFNGSIRSWNVSNVTDMNLMFSGATAFNQDISYWPIGTVSNINMDRMFLNATAFNQDITGWNVSKVTDMSLMFSGATSFNQNLGLWDISGGTIMDNIISNIGLDILNKSVTFKNWAVTATTNNIRDVNFSSPISIYSSTSTAIDTLIGLGWTFTNVTYTNDPVLAVQYNEPRTRTYIAANGFANNTRMPPYKPSLYGTYTSLQFSVTPAFPFSISMNTPTLDISGIRRSPSPATDYVISIFANNDPSTQIDISLNFTFVRAMSYIPDNKVLLSNVPIIPWIPTVFFQYPSQSFIFSNTTIYPVPDGFNLNSSNGTITGTPTEISPPLDTLVFRVSLLSYQTVIVFVDLGIYVSDISYSTLNYVFMAGESIIMIEPTIYSPYPIATITPSGTLPNGISFDVETGNFSGTPTTVTTTPVTFSLTIAIVDTYTDANGLPYTETYSKTLTFSFAVADINYSYLTYDFLAGVNIGQIQPNANTTRLYGGTIGFIEELPSGMNLDLSGNISGTPLNYSAQNTYTLAATTPSNYQKTINFSFSVSDISYNPLSYAFLAGVPINSIAPTINQIFRSTTVQLYLSDPTNGLTFDPVTYIISGTPLTAMSQYNYRLIESTANTDPGASYSKIIPFSFRVEDISYNYLTYDFLAGVNIGQIQPNASTYLYGTTMSLPNVPSGLSLNSTTGIITGVPLNYSAQNTYTLTATLGAYQKSYNFVFSVSDISYTTLAYVFIAGVNVGNITPLINQLFGTTAVSLNLSTIAGLSFNQGTGVISGTPTSAKSQATYPLIASAVNPSASYSKTLPFVLTVADISYAPLSYVYLENQEFLYLPTPGTTIVPLAYTPNLFSSLLFTPPLPNNLTIDIANGVIKGTPTVAAANPTYQLTATTSNGYVKNIPFNITVEGFNYSQSSSAFNLGDPVNLTIVQNVGAGGGYSNFTITPNLPTGLSMDPITGTISGVAERYAIDNRKIYYITGYRNPTITIQLILEIIDDTIQCDYICPPSIIVPRQVDTINTQTMRFSSLMRIGLGQTRFISNSGTNINRTYAEPPRNKF